MRRIVLLLLFIVVAGSKGNAQAINTQDSLALVGLYDSTGGPNWVNHTNWLTSSSVSSWYGVNVSGGRVSSIMLTNNKLVGKIPSSIGDLTSMYLIVLSSNQLVGFIPSSVINMTSLAGFIVDHNQLSGNIPSFGNKGLSLQIDISYNQFNFTPIESIWSSQYNLNYFPQADIPLHTNGSTLSVSAGGTLSKNTYIWYNGNTLITTKTGDSTLTISGEGDYNVAVTNSVANQLTLYSIDTAKKQDSLALVDFYNNAAGSTWVNNTNWLTSAPIDTWYGVTVRAGRVTSLQLTYNKIKATIPNSLGRLSSLRTLDLSNNQLYGSITDSLGNLLNLTGISLGSNNLTGTIPIIFGSLHNLTTLDIGRNMLSGNIPSVLGDITSLLDLYLWNNQLTGGIPVSLGNLTQLKYLYINNNQLSDTIPASLGNLSFLNEFYANNNQLAGSIPASLGRDLQITQLYLSNNQLTGSIPDSLGLLKKMSRFDVSNNQLTGRVPDSLGALPQLFDLELNNNHLSGTFPRFTANQTFGGFNISNNDFTFNGLETLPPVYSGTTSIYAPQNNIPITKRENLLSVSAGGTFSNNTFRLYKDGVLSATQTGDSVFSITNTGKYSITIANSIATQLTLQSDTATVGITLADTTTIVTQSIAGTLQTDINNGIYKLVSITPSAGANPLNGNVSTIVAIDSTVETYHNQPYVQRHYDIAPAVNAATAQATVTLYFTQQDFDNFNKYVTINNTGIPLLPTGGIYNGNLRIIQLHGSFTATPDPRNYHDSTTVFISPSVSWDNTDKWWVVTFPVNGFSGFFVSTANFTLPLTLLDFKGSLKSNAVFLQWSTTNELLTKDFTIERSADGNRFEALGKVNAASLAGIQNYNFTDMSPITGNNFYRLVMTDIDGKFSSSNIILVEGNEKPNSLFAYPNPVINQSILQFSSELASEYVINITDESGKTVKAIRGSCIKGINEINIDLHNYASGIYIITLNNGIAKKQNVFLQKL